MNGVLNYRLGRSRLHNMYRFKGAFDFLWKVLTMRVTQYCCILINLQIDLMPHYFRIPHSASCKVILPDLKRDGFDKLK